MKSQWNKIGLTMAAAFCLSSLFPVTSVLGQSGSRNSVPAPAPQRQTQQPTQPRSSRPILTSPRDGRIGFDQFDHRTLDQLLQSYVDPLGNVDYAAWQENRRDRESLVGYLQEMGRLDTSIRSSREAEMAFWINAYNALTLEGILQVFPTTSIKNHAPDANGFNIWDDFKLRVNGQDYSLNDIEHKILRPMGDPRIHFAIVCASKGCPQLAQRAYFPGSLDQQLNDNARVFFQDPNKFRFDSGRRLIELSPIIQWFGEDFGRNDGERLRYLSQFMPREAARLASEGATISYLDYDWGLNLASRPRAAAATETLRLQDQPSLQGQPRSLDRPSCQSRCSGSHDAWRQVP